MEPYKDRMRQLIDLAITAGRALQSPQTRFIHHCYSLRDEQVDHTIPLYENFLFVLALLRIRFPSLTEEAKALLDPLLYFQNQLLDEQKGNFPIYIHDYPKCKDRFLSIKLLPVFYWILLRHAGVLGEELRARTEQAAKEMLRYSLSLDFETLPFVFAIKLAAASCAFGKLWQHSEWQSLGEERLSILLEKSQDPEFGTWCVPPYAAHSFISLQMLYPDLSQTPWKHLWKHLCACWDRQALTYIGPGVKEEQWGRESFLTLFDYVMCYLGENFPYRCFQQHIAQLEGALVQPCEVMIPALPLNSVVEGEVAHHRYTICRRPLYSLSLMQKKALPDPVVDNTFLPFRMVWGSEMRARSFVVQGGNASVMDYELHDEGVDLTFVLDQGIDTNHKEKSREILFYLDMDPDDEITVDGQKATVFRFKDKIVIDARHLKITLTFDRISGEGTFQGHLAAANRPSQRDLHAEKRFEVYDRILFLRTIRRPGVVQLRVSIRVEESSDKSL